MLIVDDHPVVVEGLTMVLSGYDDLKIVGSASCGDEALQKYTTLQPDVVLMDLSMPDVDGVEATRLILRSDRRIADALRNVAAGQSILSAEALHRLIGGQDVESV